MKEDIYKYGIETILGGLIAWITKVTLSLKKKNEATQNGVKALLRDRIIATYDMYMEKEYMPVYAKTNLEEMYHEYKNLKGNGVIDELYNELLALPPKDKHQ